jgi:5'(3')-deoxyribonucleotidase
VVAGEMPVLGVDYDGTIADANRMKAKWVLENLNFKVPSWKCSRALLAPLIGFENYEELSRVVYGKEWSLNAPPVEGAIEGLRELRRLGKVYIVTVRSESGIRWAMEWMKSQKIINLVEGFISASERSKDEICRNHSLNVLVDDDIRHLTNMKGDFLKILIKAGGPRKWPDCPEDVQYVSSWEELLSKVKLFLSC